LGGRRGILLGLPGAATLVAGVFAPAADEPVLAAPGRFSFGAEARPCLRGGQAQNVVTKKFVCTAAVNAGDILVVDTANAGQVTTTNTANNTKIIGAARGTVAAGATCEVALSGVLQVNIPTMTAVTLGDMITSTTTAGLGAPNATPAVGTVIGKAIQAKSAGTGSSVWVILREN